MLRVLLLIGHRAEINIPGNPGQVRDHNYGPEDLWMSLRKLDYIPQTFPVFALIKMQKILSPIFSLGTGALHKLELTSREE